MNQLKGYFDTIMSFPEMKQPTQSDENFKTVNNRRAVIEASQSSRLGITKILCPTSQLLESSVPYLVSVGADKTLRYWNLGKSKKLSQSIPYTTSYLINSPLIRRVEYLSNFYGTNYVVQEVQA